MIKKEVRQDINNLGVRWLEVKLVGELKIKNNNGKDRNERLGLRIDRTKTRVVRIKNKCLITVKAGRYAFRGSVLASGITVRVKIPRP